MSFEIKIRIPTSQEITDEAASSMRTEAEVGLSYADPNQFCVRWGGDELVYDASDLDRSGKWLMAGSKVSLRWREAPHWITQIAPDAVLTPRDIIQFENSESEATTDSLPEDLPSPWGALPGTGEVIRDINPYNEGRECLTVYSGRFDPLKPVKLIIYMPGINRYDGNGTIDGMLRQGFQEISADVKEAENVVLMLLESPYDPNEHQQWFEDTGSFDAFLSKAQSDVERRHGGAPLHFDTQLLAHSASGGVVSRLAERDEIDHRVNNIVFLDASYGGWAESLVKNLNGGTTHFECIYNAYDPKTCGGATALNNPSYQNVTLTPTRSGHMAIPIEYLNRVLP